MRAEHRVMDMDGGAGPDAGALRKAVLKSFDAGTYTASVQLTGTVGGYLTGVPVARNIAAGEMVAGRYAALAQFDVTHPGDAVVVAVWV